MDLYSHEQVRKKASAAAVHSIDWPGHSAAVLSVPLLF
jgi:hypothetical protein